MSDAIGERLAWLRELVEQGPTPLFATLSGAHLYGFESAHSDFDLRGAFVAPLREVLRLRPPVETHSVTEVREGLALGWVAHDVAKFVRLLTRRNGYVLEQLYSPLVVRGGPWLDELHELGRGCVVRNVYPYYHGFFRNQRRLLEDEDGTVERLLTCLRVLLTGIHVLRTGEVEANLTRLAEAYGIREVAELVERKRSGAEDELLQPGEVGRRRPLLEALEARLVASFEASELPESVTNLDALEDYVVRARLELGAPPPRSSDR